MVQQENRRNISHPPSLVYTSRPFPQISSLFTLFVQKQSHFSIALTAFTFVHHFHQ